MTVPNAERIRTIVDKQNPGARNDPLGLASPDTREGAPSTDLHFDVSTGLKRVLGRELITNDEVAIFEMVKNSFDAKARTVYLHVDADSITIADDGSGMTFEDLQNKWLFVAYSAKRIGNGEEFRDRAAERKQYAGNKGIGRFSSDRLGERLVLQTRSAESCHLRGSDLRSATRFMKVQHIHKAKGRPRSA